MCPKGDDPLTPFYRYYTIEFRTSANSYITSGSFYFRFNGQSFLFAGNATYWTAAKCKTAFENLRNVDTVTCYRGSINSYGGSTYTVVFKSFPAIPFDSNFYINDGNPSIDSFTCENFDVDNTTIPLCKVSLVSNDSALPGN